MKLLPKKVDIEKAKNEERRKEIDSGAQLAASIDKLRATKVSEEKALFEWRANSLRLIQKEIDDYIIVRDNIKTQTEEAEVYRKKLLEPLDKEWEEINQTKEQIVQEKETTFIQKEQLKLEKQKIKIELNKISDVIARIKKKEADVEKAKSDAVSLRELAQREYEVAREASQSQNDDYERKMSEASQRCKEYEVALSLVEIREKEVEEKEVELLKDKKHLETQQVALRIAKEELQK